MSKIPIGIRSNQRYNAGLSKSISMVEETNASLKQQLRDRENEVWLLQHIASTITHTLDIEALLDQIVDLMSKTMLTDACFIYLLRNKKLVLKAAKGEYAALINKVSVKYGEGLTGTAAKQKKTIMIETDAHKDPRFIFVPGLDDNKWQTFVTVPIVFKDEVVGSINIQEKDPKEYTHEQIKLLETIASQIGGAISNAQLVSEMQTLREALTTRKEVAKAKGLLMKEHNVTEEEAYEMIRKKSMNTKKTMREVSKAIILTLNTT